MLMKACFADVNSYYNVIDVTQ